MDALTTFMLEPVYTGWEAIAMAAVVITVSLMMADWVDRRRRRRLVKRVAADRVMSALVVAQEVSHHIAKVMGLFYLRQVDDYQRRLNVDGDIADDVRRQLADTFRSMGVPDDEIDEAVKKHGDMATLQLYMSIEMVRTQLAKAYETVGDEPPKLGDKSNTVLLSAITDIVSRALSRDNQVAQMREIFLNLKPDDVPNLLKESLKQVGLDMKAAGIPAPPRKDSP